MDNNHGCPCSSEDFCGHPRTSMDIRGDLRISLFFHSYPCTSAVELSSKLTHKSLPADPFRWLCCVEDQTHSSRRFCARFPGPGHVLPEAWVQSHPPACEQGTYQFTYRMFLYRLVSQLLVAIRTFLNARPPFGFQRILSGSPGDVWTSRIP